MGSETRAGTLSGFRLPRARGNLTGARKWAVLVLFLLPLALLAIKTLDLPGAAFLQRAVSLANMPLGMQSRVGHVLFVPLGAVMVVFFRVTLGIRLLGPFRSILLAIAFQVTGIALGLFFLAVVIGVIVAIRPLLKAIRLPYFARVSAALSAVAAIMMVTMIVGQWLDVSALHRVAYFPIVVLCLTGDGFARTLRREGRRSAIWRGVMTALVAVVISLLTQIRGFAEALVRFPELLILELGLIIVIAEFFGYRLFVGLNPPVKKKRRKKRRKKKKKKKTKSGGQEAGTGRAMEESRSDAPDLPAGGPDASPASGGSAAQTAGDPASSDAGQDTDNRRTNPGWRPPQ